MGRIEPNAGPARLRPGGEEGEKLVEAAFALTLLAAGVTAAMGVLTGKLGGWIHDVAGMLLR